MGFLPCNNQDSVILGLNFAPSCSVVFSCCCLCIKWQISVLLCCYDHYDLSCDVPYLFLNPAVTKEDGLFLYFESYLQSLCWRKGNVFTAFTEMVVYSNDHDRLSKSADSLYGSPLKRSCDDLLIGFCASSISVAAVMYLHFRMYNKQQEILEEARIEASQRTRQECISC